MSDETEYDWEELDEKGPLLGPPIEITETVYNTIHEQCIVITKYLFFFFKDNQTNSFQVILDFGTVELNIQDVLNRFVFMVFAVSKK